MNALVAELTLQFWEGDDDSFFALRDHYLELGDDEAVRKLDRTMKIYDPHPAFDFLYAGSLEIAQKMGGIEFFKHCKTLTKRNLKYFLDKIPNGSVKHCLVQLAEDPAYAEKFLGKQGRADWCRHWSNKHFYGRYNPEQLVDLFLRYELCGYLKLYNDGSAWRKLRMGGWWSFRAFIAAAA